jgi:hypothetical protein
MYLLLDLASSTDTSQYGPSSITSLEAIQQSLLNQYHQNPLFSKATASDGLDLPASVAGNSSLEAIK